MGRNRKADREFKSTLDVIKESSQIIAKNTEHTNEKLDVMRSDIGEIKKSSTSKLPVIIAIISLLVTVSGVSVVGVSDRWKSKMEPEVKTVDDKSESELESQPEYKIYLYPEYSTFNIGMKIDMTASLNFETDAVIITAYLASGGENTVSLERKNATEWQKKVEFTETGVHEIVVTATAPNGKVIENSIEVEVTPVSIDMDRINQYLGL
jgi:hypothetical protein